MVLLIRPGMMGRHGKGPIAVNLISMTSGMESSISAPAMPAAPAEPLQNPAPEAAIAPPVKAAAPSLETPVNENDVATVQKPPQPVPQEAQQPPQQAALAAQAAEQGDGGGEAGFFSFHHFHPVIDTPEPDVHHHAAMMQAQAQEEAPWQYAYASDPNLSETDLDNIYFQILKNQFNHNWMWPPKGLSGQVEMLLYIDRYGEIKSVDITKSSGNNILDACAVETLRATRTVSPPPGRLMKNSYYYEMPFTFVY